jgi:hypothetical protein
MSKDIFREIKDSFTFPYGRAEGGQISGNEVNEAAITLGVAGAMHISGITAASLNPTKVVTEEVRVLVSGHSAHPQLLGHFTVDIDVWEPCYDPDNDGDGSQKLHRRGINFPEMTGPIDISKEQIIPCRLPKPGLRIK